MSKNESNRPTPLEKLYAFLQPDEDERDFLSHEEAEEELSHMETLGGLMGQAASDPIHATDEFLADEPTTLAAAVPDFFGDGIMLPALSAFKSAQLVYSGALSDGAGRGEESVKEILLQDFFSESVLAEHLQWAEPTIRIAREVNDAGNTARYVAFADVRAGEVRGGRSLHIVLKTSEGQSSEVTLSADYPASIFMGDALPSDWSDIRPHLSLT